MKGGVELGGLYVAKWIGKVGAVLKPTQPLFYVLGVGNSEM